MAKVATPLLREAFLDPIRFALLVDDKFPLYPRLAEGGFDAALDNPRAKALFNMCRARGWLCDVDNRGAVAEQFEEQKHLHQSDLLILDFNLDPADQNDPTAALRILQRLAASPHFNLAVVYTNADASEVMRDIVFSLGGGANLDEPAEDAARTLLEDLEEDAAADVSAALTWGVVDGYLRGAKPGGAANDLRARLTAAGIAPADQGDVIVRLASERMRSRMKPEVLAARPAPSHVDSSAGKTGVQWASQGNLFVAIVNKAEEPAVLPDRLVEALEAWDPSPLHVMMMHARSALERAGTLADRVVLETPRLQAGWLLRILLGKTEPDHRESIGELYGRLFERLARNVEPSIVDFGMRLIAPGAVDDAVASAKGLAGAPAALGSDNVYHALNAHLSSDACPDGPMTTGVVIKAIRAGGDQYWVCTSPACDLVPGQNMKGWDKDLHPLRPISIARLNRLKSPAAIRSALQNATHGRHLFLLVDDATFAFEVADPISRQMELEIALLEGDGVIQGGIVKGHLVNLDEGRPEFIAADFSVIAKLRTDYANRLLAQSGQQRSRIGVDFFNLPTPV